MRNSVWMFMFLLCLVCGQTSGMFLQAISAALGTIPFTGGPITMTAGLAGLKLAVGSKLLYFLGYFGRRAPKPPSLVTTAARQKPSSLRSPFPQGYSAVPLPYMYASGGGGRGGFGQHQLSMPPQSFPQSFAGQQFGGAGAQFTPSQLMQAYGAMQGAGAQFTPSQLMQAYGAMQGAGQGQFLPSEYGTHPQEYGDQGIYPQVDFPGSAGGGSNSQPFPFGMTEGHTEGSSSSGGVLPPDGSMGMSHEASDPMNQPSADASEADVDNFFSFLAEMDENTCISRLICDIGVNPQFLGEFSQNIDNIISSLEVPPGSRAHHYISIMQQGRDERGGCADRFDQCTDDAYEIVKSVAPAVGVPSNLENFNLS